MIKLFRLTPSTRFLVVTFCRLMRMCEMHGYEKENAMLVLSRHRNESIVICDNIVITVVDIRSDKVRLGIEAPVSIPVHRREVYDAIQRDNQEAAKLKPADPMSPDS